jgi:SSS family solute:Na+ symporter
MRMQHQLQALDYAVFLFYFIVVAGYGYWIYSRRKKGGETSTDYFLAEGSLTWFAIGASLIASNISAEQFIGMSGAGFGMGLAIASYEWMAAATLILVAVFFMPVYLKNRIFTMPQFLSTRYNDTVAMIMVIFWLLLYVVVNLTSILFLGALAVSTISGISFSLCMTGLALFAVFITLGGMKVIGFTDVIQVFFLTLGGLVTTYLALNLVAEKMGSSGALSGFNLLLQHAPDHFHMIIKRDSPYYLDMPGMTVLLGGMWIANFSYWGCNQYITQRALGASLPTARKGILFAAFLKLLMPLIVVLPGIAAYFLYQQGDFHAEMMKDGKLAADNAYPVLLNLLPAGLKGLSFAALTAAIVASLAGKTNSIATIFTLDIYKKVINKNANEKQQVKTGKTVVVTAMLIAVIIAPYLGIDKGGLNYIQEYTGFVSPGIFAMFIMGFFWKRTTSNAALFATIGGFLFSVFLKFLPQWTDLSALASTGFAKANAAGAYEIPFMDRMGFVFLFCVAGMFIISIATPANAYTGKALEVDTRLFKTDKIFLAGSLLIAGILIALYSIFW